jgi:cell division protein FtsI (penicillin-binding protein 3)
MSMLEAVVGEGGTGQRATVAGYRVAGKTGTVKKFAPGGYSEDRYMAVFSGIAPATRPRLAVVVVIDDPSNGEYYGGVLAAPVFSRVVEGALRILAIPPDNFVRPSATTKLAASRP